MVFSANSNTLHWYVFKQRNELWLGENGSEKPLESWILEAKESNVGYFEVYELSVQGSPFYASA